MSRRFDNRCALVTGAARAIGWATAKRLAEEGASVIVWDRDNEAINEAHDDSLKSNRPAMRIEQVNLLDLHAIEQGVSDLVAREGRTDVLINNVGGEVGFITGVMLDVNGGQAMGG